MKTFTATLSKPGKRLVATVRYKETSWPDLITFTGDAEDFRFDDGTPITLKASLGKFEQTARFQAAQVGATIAIEDDGGEAVQWVDQVIAP